MAIEIVDLLSYKMVIFHSYVEVYQRVLRSNCMVITFLKFLISKIICCLTAITAAMCWFGSPSSRISVLWNLTVGIECGNMGSENGSYPKLGVYFSIGVPQTTGFPIRKITHFGWLWGPTLPAQELLAKSIASVPSTKCTTPTKCLQADLRGKVDPEVDIFFGLGIFDQRMRDSEDFFWKHGDLFGQFLFWWWGGI